jgi:hypothetical protein
VLISPEKQAHFEPGVAGSCFTACGRHHDQAAVGSELQYRLTILGADQGELLGCEPQLRRKPQRREAIGAWWNVVNWDYVAQRYAEAKKE